MSRKRSGLHNSRASEWRHKEELIELLEALPRVAVGDGYSEKDRAGDFMLVFGTEPGRRVLAQIATICQPITRDSELNSLGVLAAKEGKRQVLTEIQRCFLVKEPVRIERVTDPITGEREIVTEGGV